MSTGGSCDHFTNWGGGGGGRRNSRFLLLFFVFFFFVVVVVVVVFLSKFGEKESANFFLIFSESAVYIIRGD